MAAAENALKSREVSAMIKQGFISDHHTLSLSPSRLPPPPPPQTTNSFPRVYSPSSSTPPPPPPPPPQPTPPTHSHSQSQSQTLYEMMSEEQHRESKLSDDRRRKLHLRVSKILDETQTRTTSFQDRNGTDGLGFGFGIGSGGDVKVLVVGRDGFRVTMEMHKSVLEEKSQFLIIT